MFKQQHPHSYWLVPLFVSSLLACGGPEQPQLSSLDKQALQTRTYKQSKEIVFNSVVSFLQDQGFVISSADKDSGFINATSPQETTSSFGAELFLGQVEEQNVKCNAFIEALPNSTRLRLTFLLTTKSQQHSAILTDSDSWGTGRRTQEDKPIYDRQMYQNAFNLIEEAIFLRTPSPSN